MSFGRLAAALSALMAIALIVMLVFVYMPPFGDEPRPECTGESVVNDLGETVCLDPDCPVHGAPSSE